MVKSKVYKGIEYVQLSSLPREQQENFKHNFNQELIIKIKIGDKIISDCILYKDYTTWFESVYATNRVESKDRKEKAVPLVDLQLSVGKT